MVPKMVFKFCANNFNFIRIKLGCVNLNVVYATNEHHICNQYLK